MRHFKNKRAKELFEEAEYLENYANKKLEEGVLIEHGPGEWFTEAAGLRALADDIEEGIKEEEEFER